MTCEGGPSMSARGAAGVVPGREPHRGRGVRVHTEPGRLGDGVAAHTQHATRRQCLWIRLGEPQVAHGFRDLTTLDDPTSIEQIQAAVEEIKQS